MKTKLRHLVLSPDMQKGLPVGFRQILVSDAIMDEQTTKLLTMEQPKFGHSSPFVRRHRKPISKPEI